MRQIVLDTETTGLEVEAGHRIIEIGCVELCHRRLTGNDLHLYINPDRAIDPGAQAVHGISNAFLADKPFFADIATQLDDYLADAELLIHNAPFDLGFLNAERARLASDCAALEARADVVDTLIEARRLYPGQRNSLDALCRRLAVDDSAREMHGALLDAQLLAEVYLAMTGGQTAIFFDQTTGANAGSDWVGVAELLNSAGRRPRVQTASEDERTAHARYLQRLDEASDGRCLWQTFENRE